MAEPLFSDVPTGPPDPMFHLKKASDSDLSPQKIDVGIGVYRGLEPGYHEFKAITKVKWAHMRQVAADMFQAKQKLERRHLGHEVCHLASGNLRRVTAYLLSICPLLGSNRSSAEQRDYFSVAEIKLWTTVGYLSQFSQDRALADCITDSFCADSRRYWSRSLGGSFPE